MNGATVLMVIALWCGSPTGTTTAVIQCRDKMISCVNYKPSDKASDVDLKLWNCARDQK